MIMITLSKLELHVYKYTPLGSEEVLVQLEAIVSKSSFKIPYRLHDGYTRPEKGCTQKADVNKFVYPVFSFNLVREPFRTGRVSH